jgi:LysR family glycine cleavage system transcriptional activator
MKDDLPPLNALRAFEATGRRLSMSAAADEMHVTTGAVSRQIRALEQFLGAALFDRGHRQIALTPLGQTYYAMAAQALQQIRDTTERLRKPRDAL